MFFIISEVNIVAEQKQTYW